MNPRLCRFVGSFFVVWAGWLAGLGRADEPTYRYYFQRGFAAAKNADHAAAVQHYERAAPAAVATFGEYHKDTAVVFNELGNAYVAQAQYAKAETALQRSRAIYERISGAESEQVAMTLNNLGLLYDAIAEHRKAEDAYQKCIAIREKQFGADSREVSPTIFNLAMFYRNIGRYRDSERLTLRALKIDERLYGPNHLEVAADLNQLGLLAMDTGAFTKAEALFQRALAIREAQLGPNHTDVGMVVNNLAIVYQRLGHYVQAEPLLQRSLKIEELLRGPNHPETATSLNNLAVYYDDLGQFDKAVELYRRAQKIDEAAFGPDHPQIALRLNNLGHVFTKAKRYAEAEAVLQRCLKIREAKLGRDHEETGDACDNLGFLHSELEQLEAAEAFFERSVKIYSAALGPDHPKVAHGQLSLASTWIEQGHPEKAESMLPRLLLLNEKIYGVEHPRYAAALQKTAVYEVTRGRPEAAVEKFEQARRIARTYIARTLTGLSAREQLDYLTNTERRALDEALSPAIAFPDNAEIAARTAMWSANSKNLAFEVVAEAAQLARDARDPALAATAERLQTVRSELAAIANASRPSAEQRGRVVALAEEEQALAKKITSARGTATGDAWVALADIRQAIPTDAALVDIVRLDATQFGRSGQPAKKLGERYVAWVIPSADRGDVKVVDLGPAKKIDFAVNAVRAAMADSAKVLATDEEAAAEKVTAKPLEALGELVLAPLLPHIKATAELILSPDSALWLAPWSALRVDGQQYAVEHWRLRFVASSRELALDKRRTATVTPGAARIVADPDYSLNPSAALAAYHTLLYPGTTLPAAPPTRPSNGNLLALRSTSIGRVERLPFTAVEAELVAPQLKSLTQTEPKVYTQRHAQEGVLKLIRNPRVLLVSTHGYFLPQPKSAAEGSLENPLLRCGLLLAGCNERAAYNDPRLGDGVMTGLEIVGCDFRGTELVVLSACETGVGEVSQGEGVAGLRQAFQLAGARGVVSTLWQIPDKQSALLMGDFFANLAAGQSHAEALRSAQLRAIETRRKNQGAAHKLFWAAWTLTGA